MTRGIVIAGNESALIGAIEAEAARRVEHFALALIPDRPSEADAGFQSRRSGSAPAAGGVPVEKARIGLQWNPGSPISARTLTLAAENRLGQIDEAILVCDPPLIRCAAADLSIADIEAVVNNHIKGWFFLTRELAAIFRSRGAGSMALVYTDTGAAGGKDDAVDLLGSASLAAFRAFTHGLLASSSGEPYITMGFSCSDAVDAADFAAFVLKTLEGGSRRDNGKLHKYGKLNLFTGALHDRFNH